MIPGAVKLEVVYREPEIFQLSFCRVPTVVYACRYCSKPYEAEVAQGTSLLETTTYFFGVLGYFHRSFTDYC